MKLQKSDGVSVEVTAELKALHELLDKARVALLHVKDRLPSPKENDYHTAQRISQVIFDNVPELAGKLCDLDIGSIYPEYREAWDFMIEGLCSSNQDYKDQHGKDRF